MKVLFVTQIVDKTDSNLGAIHGWIAAMAQQVDEIHVLALNTGVMELPSNVVVHPLGKNQGNSKAAQSLIFYTVAGRLALGHRVDVFFPHAVPRYAILVAPLRAAFRIPTVMWYSHNSADLKLRIAHRFVDRFVSASVDSFPLRTEKCRVVGMGIDTELFRPAREEGPSGSGRTRFLTLGRISPRKELDTFISAADLLVNHWGLTDAEFVVAGEPLAAEDQTYRDRLRARVRELQLEDHVRFVGGVPHSETAQHMRGCDYFVNMHVEGGLGKAVMEGMSCGKPAIVSTPTYYERFPEYGKLFVFEPKDPESLAARMRSALEVADADRRKIGKELREWVVSEHDLGIQMSRIVQVFESVRGGRKN